MDAKMLMQLIEEEMAKPPTPPPLLPKRKKKSKDTRSPIPVASSIKMIETIIEEEMMIANEDFNLDTGEKQLTKYSLQDFMDDIVPLVTAHGGTYQGSRSKTPVSDTSGHTIIHFTGLGALRDRNKLINDLYRNHDSYFRDEGKTVPRRQHGSNIKLFHRIQTVFVNKHRKPIYLQFNAGQANAGFALEEELKDLFRQAGVLVNRPEMNRPGPDLYASIDIGAPFPKWTLKIEVKKAFGKQAEMAQIGIKPAAASQPSPVFKIQKKKTKAQKKKFLTWAQNTTFEYKKPRDPIEAAIQQSTNKSNPPDLDGQPVDRKVIDVLFAEKFPDYDKFFIKDGFYDADRVKEEGQFFYRFREKDPAPHQRFMLVIYLAGGLDEKDKKDLEEMSSEFLDLIDAGTKFTQ